MFHPLIVTVTGFFMLFAPAIAASNVRMWGIRRRTFPWLTLPPVAAPTSAISAPILAASAPIQSRKIFSAFSSSVVSATRYRFCCLKSCGYLFCASFLMLLRAGSSTCVISSLFSSSLIIEALLHTRSESPVFCWSAHIWQPMACVLQPVLAYLHMLSPLCILIYTGTRTPVDT